MEEFRMRVCVTERSALAASDLRSAGELAPPSLALPWIVKLRYGVRAGLVVLILVTPLTTNGE